MRNALCVTVWGVRGSSPVPSADFMEYGGNTSCFSADCGDTLAVFDAGSGLVGLGARMAELDGPRRADIFLSHLHLDHVQGLVSFQPLFLPGKEIHLYGRPGLAEALDQLFSPPWWPVGLASLSADLQIHELRPGEAVSLPGGSEVSTLEGRHPNGCLVYRLDSGGGRLVYALDCEPDAAFAGRLAEFARGAGLLVWDASFTEEDLKPGWGHSTWQQGLALAQTAGIRRVLMAHYSTSYNDAFLRAQEELARQLSSAVSFAKEGMVIEL